MKIIDELTALRADLWGLFERIESAEDPKELYGDARDGVLDAVKNIDVLVASLQPGVDPKEKP